MPKRLYADWKGIIIAKRVDCQDFILKRDLMWGTHTIHPLQLKLNGDTPLIKVEHKSSKKGFNSLTLFRSLHSPSLALIAKPTTLYLLPHPIQTTN